MEKLSEPSKELIAKIITEVEFKERLIGYRMRRRTGPTSVALYSFEEVVGLLNDSHPRIDFNQLEKWVRETIKDVELAEKIGKVIKKDSSEEDKTWEIRNLMGERLIQCKS